MTCPVRGAVTLETVPEVKAGAAIVTREAGTLVDLRVAHQAWKRQQAVVDVFNDDAVVALVRKKKRKMLLEVMLCCC